VYPNLTVPLLALVAVALLAAGMVALRRPFLRRLALRQVGRRRGEALLVIAGSALGTAIIVGSLIVGDTLGFSVKRDADRQLGPIDEVVSSQTPAQGVQAARLVAVLRGDPDIDGLLTLRLDQAAVAHGDGAAPRAEPRANVVEVDFADAARFGGGRDGGSGLGGPAPSPGEAVLNDQLAAALGAKAGDTVTFWLYGRPTAMRVARVVPSRGIAGVGIQNARNAFLALGTLERLAPKGAEPQVVTVVSNTGGIEGGNARSNAVASKLTRALGPLAASPKGPSNGAGAVRDGPVTVDKVKQDALDGAKSAAAEFGQFFLFIGSFSIIAGVMLLVNVFVMLAEERKGELGVLRAIGMRRGRLIAAFLIEGTLYALVAGLAGVAAGFGVGRAVVEVAGRIFDSLSSDQGRLQLSFHASPVSVANGLAFGFLIAFLTVAMTSIRVSRLNVIAAIRDLPSGGGRRLKWRWVALSTLAASGFGAAAVLAISRSQGVGTYLLPALAALALCPLLVRMAPKRLAYSVVALGVLAWTLAANTVRPHLFDDGSTATYVVLGVVLTFAAVFLLSQNQELVTAPLRPLIARPSASGLAARLAFAYPLARRFRTGSILVMYSLVVFTLVLVAVLTSVVSSTREHEVASASGGFAIRADLNPSAPVADPATAFRSGRFAGRVAAAVPLYAARGQMPAAPGASDGPRGVTVLGADPTIAEAGLFPLEKRLDGLGGDRQVWRSTLSDPRYVITTHELIGGSRRTQPGDSFTLTDPRTGRTERKTVAGVLRSPQAFFGRDNQGTPVIMGMPAVRAQFGSEAKLSAVLVKAAPGVPDQALAAELQGSFLAHGLVATSIRHEIDQEFAANVSFNQLMEGFLALGLLIGIGGLGVVMVRAVRERRRSVGVLRALGFQARVVHRAFLSESAFIALEGIVLGSALGIVTTYVLFRNDADFKAAHVPFSVPWLSIAVLLSITAAASLLATVWPARQAARLRPAVALRIAD
jgi:putative ABC transport system permease protein